MQPGGPHTSPPREARRTILDGGKPSANIRSSEASLYAVNILEGESMRLYRAVCAWLEAHAQQMGNEQESGRDTQLDALVETAHSYTTQPEMHIANRGTSIDDEDGGAYKHRRVGFARNP